MTEAFNRWINTILSEETVEEGEMKGMIRVEQRVSDGSVQTFFVNPEHWEEQKEEMRRPECHAQEELAIRGPTPKEREQTSQFMENATPRAFCEHTVSETGCRLVCGRIPADQNECSGGEDLFYRATFVPLLSPGKRYYVVCETGFDVYYERQTIRFTYDEDSGVVRYTDEYRTVNAKDDYSLLGNLVYYEKRERMLCGKDSMPWIRFPRTKDGVSIPLLIHWILCGGEANLSILKRIQFAQ